MAEAEAVSHGALHPAAIWRSICCDLRPLAGLSLELMFCLLTLLASVLAPEDLVCTE